MRWIKLPSIFFLVAIVFFVTEIADAALKCDLCGQTITGSYNHYPDIGIDVCSQCEKTKPRCDSCQRPANELLRVGSARLCERCAANAERCHSCDTALLRDYTYFEGNETLKYCSECVARYPICADCGAPAGSRGTKLDDGRYLCPDCRSVALFSPALVTPIKKQVISYLDGGMGMRIRHDIKYSLQDKDFLKTKSKNMHGDLNALFYRKGDDYNIYVLYGLRKKDLIGAIAHEITHAWQAENCGHNLQLEDLEGFAQWVAYHTLLYFGYEQFAKTMPSGSSAYAVGLRKMLEIEKHGGSNAVFDYIKSR